jgi:hypothetical protein
MEVGLQHGHQFGIGEGRIAAKGLGLLLGGRTLPNPIARGIILRLGLCLSKPPEIAVPGEARQVLFATYGLMDWTLTIFCGRTDPPCDS